MTTNHHRHPLLLRINYRWHHAVNDRSKLESALDDFGLMRMHQHQQRQRRRGGENDVVNTINYPITAIEADVIVRHSTTRCFDEAVISTATTLNMLPIAVMGHPPAIDGNLTIKSFLARLHHVGFHHATHTNNIDDEENNNLISRHLVPVVLKLDFKSEDAYRLSLDDVSNYLSSLPSTSDTVQKQHIWINADILSGPGYKEPLFRDPYEFVQLATTYLRGTTLSLGWTTAAISTRTACTDDNEDDEYCYTDEMITEMINVASSYPYHVTFAVCATYFKQSWKVLQRLYYHNVNNNSSGILQQHEDERTSTSIRRLWTVTLWLSGGRTLSDQDLRYIYETLEGDGADEKLHNRTYYDIPDFYFGRRSGR